MPASNTTAWAGSSPAPAAPPARLVVSLLAGGEAARGAALARLVEEFGPLCALSEVLPFAYTDYYRPEMGEGLTRRLAAFTGLVAPWRLAAVKRTCAALEAELTEAGRRLVNLDPGLLTAGALILATHKPRPHRPALAEGVYADLTLLYQRGAFQALPWTYRDYAGPEIAAILAPWRERYLWQLRGGSAIGKEGTVWPNP